MIKKNRRNRTSSRTSCSSSRSRAWGISCSDSTNGWLHVRPAVFAPWICPTFRPRDTGIWCSCLWTTRQHCSAIFLTPTILIAGIGLNVGVAGLSRPHLKCSGLFCCCLRLRRHGLGIDCLDSCQSICGGSGSSGRVLLFERTWCPSGSWFWMCGRLVLFSILFLKVLRGWFWRDNFINWTWLILWI